MHQIQLGTYKGLHILKSPSPTQAEIDQAVERTLALTVNQWQQQNRHINPGDTVLVRLEAKVGNTLIPELCNPQLEYEAGNSAMLPGYAHVIGKKCGETFAMQITYADNCSIHSVRGKTVDFTGTVLQVKFAQPQPLNDRLAKEIDPSAKSLIDLKQKFAQMIQIELSGKADQENYDKIFEAIAKNSQITIDQTEFDKTLKMVTEESKKMMGIQNFDHLPSPEKEQSEKQFAADCKAFTNKIITENLIIGEIIQKENMTISPEELQKNIKHFTNTPEMEQTFRKQFPHDSDYEIFLVRDKVLHQLAEWNLIENS